MQTRPLLCLGALLWTGCLDWSTAPTPDAGDDGPRLDGGTDAGPDVDAETPSCPTQSTACADRCGQIIVDGCPFDCGACEDASTCDPTSSCESIQAECGELDTGCGTVTCANQCVPGTPCVDHVCCEPEDPAITCRGRCGGTAVNRCGQEVPCENPCGPSSNGCRDAEPPVPAVCFCPHAFQGETCEQTQVPLLDLTGFAFDPVHRQGYALDFGSRAIVRIDHDTGVRSVLSDDDDDGVARGSGTGFAAPAALELDLRNRRAFVADAGRHAVFEVDLASGNRRVLSDADDDGTQRGEGIALERPRGIALDLDYDRAFVVGGLGELFQVQISTGNRTLVSTADLAGTRVGTGPKLDIPHDVKLDLAQQRAWVFTSGSLVSVDLRTGDRTLISSTSTSSNEEGLLRGNGPTFDAIESGELQLAKGRALVLDFMSGALIAIDLASGDRTLLSGSDGSESVGSGPAPRSVRSIALDPDGEHLFAADSGFATMFRIDLTTGERRTLYDGGVGTGPGLLRPVGLALQSSGAVGYVVDYELKAIVRIELSTGTRTIVANVPSDVSPSQSVTLDVSGNAAYAVESAVPVSVVRYDLTTGARTVVSDGSDSEVGAVRLSTGGLTALDAARSRILVTHGPSQSLVAVDLTTGMRTILSGSTRGTGPALGTPSGIALHPDRNRAYVVNRFKGVLEVDLQTGDRVMRSGTGADGAVVGVGPLPTSFEGAALDGAGALYVADATVGLLQIDLTSGKRTSVSSFAPDAATRRGKGPTISGPSALALEPTGRYAYLVNRSIRAVMRVDLATGDRSLVSRITF